MSAKPRSRRSAFLEVERPADSISLLLGAEADRERWHAAFLPAASARSSPKRTSRIPRSNAKALEHSESANEPVEDERASPETLNRVESYSRIMQAHTRTQMESPSSGTIPSYRKTMHAFTLNQFSHSRRSSTSNVDQHRAESGLVRMPVSLDKQADVTSPQTMLRVPLNTPAAQAIGVAGPGRGDEVHGIDFRKLKRNKTEPYAARVARTE